MNVEPMEIQLDFRESNFLFTISRCAILWSMVDKKTRSFRRETDGGREDADVFSILSLCEERAVTISAIIHASIQLITYSSSK